MKTRILNLGRYGNTSLYNKIKLAYRIKKKLLFSCFKSAMILCKSTDPSDVNLTSKTERKSAFLIEIAYLNMVL